MRWLVIALVAAACASPVKVREVSARDATWCFTARGKTPDGPQVGIACFETRRTCQRVRRNAVRYGTWSGLLSIGNCAEGTR